MKFQVWLENRSLFTKLFLFIVSIITLVVALVEVVIEPTAAHVLGTADHDLHDMDEFFVWGISILLPSLLSGYILTRQIATRLNNVTKVTKAFAEGNMEMRLPVTGNRDDAFDQFKNNFNTMADALSNMVHTQRRMLADISHELRSPLTRIQLAAALLQRSTSDDEKLSMALRIENEVNYMSEIVEHILTQSRNSMGQQATSEPINLAQLVDTLVDDFALQATSMGKKIIHKMPAELPVYGNIAALRSTVSNVISNALFYTPDKINITASKTNEDITLIVRDYGPGVPEDHLELIFRAFARVDNSRSRESGGTGLGLAMAKEAIVSHGGSIKASNAQPGLIITIVLPLYNEEELNAMY